MSTKSLASRADYCLFALTALGSGLPKASGIELAKKRTNKATRLNKEPRHLHEDSILLSIQPPCCSLEECNALLSFKLLGSLCGWCCGPP